MSHLATSESFQKENLGIKKELVFAREEAKILKAVRHSVEFF